MPAGGVTCYEENQTETMTDTPKLDLSALQEVVASLTDGLDVVSDPVWFNAQSEKVRNTLMAGVIKNF